MTQAPAIWIAIAVPLFLTIYWGSSGSRPHRVLKAGSVALFWPVIAAFMLCVVAIDAIDMIRRGPAS